MNNNVSLAIFFTFIGGSLILYLTYNSQYIKILQPNIHPTLQPVNIRSEPYFISDREIIIGHRLARLKKKCKERGLTVPNRKELPNRLMWDYHYKLVYCPVAKGGSSRWKRLFANLEGIPEDIIRGGNQMHIKTQQIFSLTNLPLKLEDKKSIIRESLSFFFVRHPFERLVSAYRDKVLNYNYSNWRGKTPKNFTREPKETRLNPDIPTFWEFSEYLISGKGFHNDEHVTPTTSYCDVCNVEYNMMGKLETSSEDNRYIMLMSSFPEEFFDPDKKSNESKGASSSEEAKKLFKTIPIQLVEKLYKFYEEDFQVFDYDYRDYLDLALS